MSAPCRSDNEPKLPAIRQYDNEDFTRFYRKAYGDNQAIGAGHQHNIMMLVGNGFDIAVLNKLNARFITDYKAFYFYLSSRKFNPDNFLFQQMNNLRLDNEIAEKEGKEGFSNWSDFEHLLQNYADEFSSASGTPQPEKVLKDLEEIQREFSKFLVDVVSPELLEALDELARTNKWAYRTFASFAADVSKDDYSRIDVLSKAKHYDVFVFNVINFNFTPLVENYLFLDQKQFIPHIHKTVDTHFQFRKNPRDLSVYPGSGNFGNAATGCSSYLVTEFYHPHGNQHTPRSLLFGIDADDDTAARGSFFQLEKPYWAQTPRRYEKMIRESDLFIIFGSSRGASDKWWWRHIVRKLFDGAQVIIYQYFDPDDPAPRPRKIASTFINDNYDPSLFDDTEFSGEMFDKLVCEVAVVVYSDPSTLSAFGFNETPYDPTSTDPTVIPEVK